MNIRDLDLNLLVALDKLIELKNVSKSALDLGVTQPAMSNILSRLRKAFGDELLIKVGRGMDLTPKAKELAIPLRRIIESIQSEVLNTRQFDPHLDPFHFKLAFHDYEQLVIHSVLMPKLLKDFPQITIEHIPPPDTHPTEDLGTGATDFSTTPVVKDRAGIKRKKLFTDSFVCLTDRKNWLLPRKGLDIQTFCKLEHMFIAPHGGVVGQVDKALADKRLMRTIRISIAEFSMAPWLIKGTNLVVTLPSRAARIFAEQHKHLVILECPVRIDPVDIFLSWHERVDKSPPHAWLKNQIIAATSSE